MNYKSIQVRIEVIDNETGTVYSLAQAGTVPKAIPASVIELDAIGKDQNIQKELLYKLWINCIATVGTALQVPDLASWLDVHRHFTPADCRII